MKKAMVVCIMGLFLLTGCRLGAQQTVDFTELTPNMSENEVVALLGQPDEVNRDSYKIKDELRKGDDFYATVPKPFQDAADEELATNIDEETFGEIVNGHGKLKVLTYEDHVQLLFLDDRYVGYLSTE